MRIGVIGCGGMGTTHYLSLKVLSEKEDDVVIRFKININEIRSKALKKSGSMVPENKLEDKSVILDSLKIYPNPE